MFVPQQFQIFLNLFVPTALGRREKPNGFFCLVNFDRSIFSSKRVVSGIIKKPIQRRIWIKKNFFAVRFLERVIEVKILVNNETDLGYIYFNFPDVLLKYVKMINSNVVDLTFKDKKNLVDNFDLIFAKVLAKYFNLVSFDFVISFFV